MLTEHPTVTWHRCKGLSTCACLSEVRDKPAGFQALHLNGHWNPAPEPCFSQHRTSKVYYSLKYFESKQLVLPLVSAWHPALTFPTLLCFICLTHQSLLNRCCSQILCVFTVNVWCPPGPELLEGTFPTFSMAGLPFNSWVFSSRGDLSGGKRGWWPAWTMTMCPS